MDLIFAEKRNKRVGLYIIHYEFFDPCKVVVQSAFSFCQIIPYSKTTMRESRSEIIFDIHCMTNSSYLNPVLDKIHT